MVSSERKNPPTKNKRYFPAIQDLSRSWTKHCTAYFHATIKTMGLKYERSSTNLACRLSDFESNQLILRWPLVCHHSSDFSQSLRQTHLVFLCGELKENVHQPFCCTRKYFSPQSSFRWLRLVAAFHSPFSSNFFSLNIFFQSTTNKWRGVCVTLKGNICNGIWNKNTFLGASYQHCALVAMCSNKCPMFNFLLALIKSLHTEIFIQPYVLFCFVLCTCDAL